MVRISRLHKVMAIFAYAYLNLVGFTSESVDVANQTFSKSRLRTIYVLGVNVITLVAMPFIYQATSHMLEDFGHTGLVLYTDLAVTLVIFAVLAFTVLTRVSRDKQFHETIKGFFSLHRDFLSALPKHKDIERRFDVIIFLKLFTTTSQLLVTFFMMYFLLPQWSLPTILMGFYYSNVAYFLHGVLLHYCLSLWFAAKCLMMLNQEILKLLHQLDETIAPHQSLQPAFRNERTLIEGIVRQLRKMANIQWRGIGLLEQCSDTYQWHMLGILAIAVMKHIAMGYYSFLVIHGYMNYHNKTMANVLGTYSYLVVPLDFFIFYRMSETYVQSTEECREILQRFQTLPRLDEHVERQVNTLVMQLAQRKACVNIGGLFCINFGSFLAICGFIITHAIILVQFDYALRQTHEAAMGFV